MRAGFQRFLADLAAADLAHPTGNPAWSVREQLMHVVYWMQYTPTAVQLVQRRTTLRSRLTRAVPAMLFDPLNIQLTHQAARRQTLQAIGQRYERAYQAALTMLNSIGDDEWALGAPFAAFHGKYRTITIIFRSLASLQTEHLDEIRRGLSRQKKGGAFDLRHKLVRSWLLPHGD